MISGDPERNLEAVIMERKRAIAHDLRTVAGQDFYAADAGALSASYCSGDR